MNKTCKNCDKLKVCWVKKDNVGVTCCDEWSGWHDAKEELPTEIKAVNAVWVNHAPVSYYAEIKDKPFTATAVYAKGKWWWYSNVCVDLLMEYGFSHDDEMDEAIEVVAWRELPEYEVEK